MTSSVVITAHPAKANNGEDLVVEIVEYDKGVKGTTTLLTNGQVYQVSVWEGRSVTVTERPVSETKHE